jgi:glycosyltransferase involved in cell wall biosynthesis
VGCSRRVLIIAYHYPPEPTSGALRMAYLAKYLPDFGWEPTVLTRRAPNNGHPAPGVIRVGRPFAMQPVPVGIDIVPRCALSAAKGALRHVVFFPDRAAAWIPPAVAAAVRAHRSRPFDAIISSAMPASVHVVGSMLSAMLGVPWLADYRDLWAGNPYVDDPVWRAKLLRGLEKGALHRARGITTVTRELAEALSALHGRPVRVIPHTYDADEWHDIPFEAPEEFRLVHAGSLYDGRRNPDRLFAQLANLRWNGEIESLRFDFYGPDAGNLMDLAARYGIEDVVHYHGVVERPAAMRAERSASLLVIIQNDDPRTANEYGSKIFEYQAAGTLILVIGPPASVLRSYVIENELGWFASSDEEIRAALRAAHRKHLEGRTLRRRAAGERPADSVAAGFAEALNGMLGSDPSQPWERVSMPARGFEESEPASLR